MSLKSSVVLLGLAFACVVHAQTQEAKDAKERSSKRESFAKAADSATTKAMPALDRVLYFMHRKEWYAAEANCQEAEEILAAVPPLVQIAHDERAQVYLAEGRYRDALNIWLPMVSDGSQPTPLMAVDMSLAYVGLETPEKAGPLLDELRRSHLSGWAEMLDQNMMPVAGGLSASNVKATALFLRAVLASDARYPNAKLSDLREALALSPRNGNIAFWVGMDIHDRQQKQKESTPLFMQAYRYGGPVVRRLSAQLLREAGEKVVK